MIALAVSKLKKKGPLMNSYLIHTKSGSDIKIACQKLEDVLDHDGQAIGVTSVGEASNSYHIIHLRYSDIEYVLFKKGAY